MVFSIKIILITQIFRHLIWRTSQICLLMSRNLIYYGKSVNFFIHRDMLNRLCHISWFICCMVSFLIWLEYVAIMVCFLILLSAFNKCLMYFKNIFRYTEWRKFNQTIWRCVFSRRIDLVISNLKYQTRFQRYLVKTKLAIFTWINWHHFYLKRYKDVLLSFF